MKRKEIAEELGGRKSTIGRELSGNRAPDGSYDPELASDPSLSRRRRGRFRNMSKEVSEYIRGGLEIGWSPERISGRNAAGPTIPQPTPSVPSPHPDRIEMRSPYHVHEWTFHCLEFLG